MEAAGEEAGMQQPVAAVGESFADGVFQAAVRRGVLDMYLFAGGQLADQRQRAQRDQGQGPHRVHPADALDQLLQHRRKNELAEGAAGIDHAGRRAARLERQTLRGGADQHGKTAGTGAHVGENAERHDQAEAAAHEGGQRATQRHQHDAADQHGARAVAVGDGAGDGLDGAPGELADGERQADRGDAQTGRRIERGNKQAEGLAAAHGDHQDAGCGKRGEQDFGLGDGAEHEQFSEKNSPQAGRQEGGIL